MKLVLLRDMDDPIILTQYVDDVVFFKSINPLYLYTLKEILLLFQVITDLAINFSKSSVYHANNNVEKIREGSVIFGCIWENFIFNILDLKWSPIVPIIFTGSSW